MLKLARRARGYFVTLIEIRVHLIRVKPGHISFFRGIHKFTRRRITSSFSEDMTEKRLSF